MLAKLHLAGTDFTAESGQMRSLSPAGGFYLIPAPIAHRHHPARRLAIDEELDFLEGAWPHGLPEGVIHADLFPDNVFFLGEKLSGLIDFYFACNDMLAYDVAICLNAWCFENDHSYNVTKGRALLQAYAKGAADDRCRACAAMPLLARGAALRFLATRVVDWLNVPPGALVRPKDRRRNISASCASTETNVHDYGVEARELA